MAKTQKLEVVSNKTQNTKKATTQKAKKTTKSVRPTVALWNELNQKHTELQSAFQKEVSRSVDARVSSSKKTLWLALSVLANIGFALALFL